MSLLKTMKYWRSSVHITMYSLYLRTELSLVGFNVALNTYWVISEMVFPANLLTGTKHPQTNITVTKNIT